MIVCIDLNTPQIFFVNMPRSTTHLLDQVVGDEFIHGELYQKVYEAAGITVPPEEPNEDIVRETYRQTLSDINKIIGSISLRVAHEVRPSYVINLWEVLLTIEDAWEAWGEFRADHGNIAHMLDLAEAGARSTSYEESVIQAVSRMRKLGELVMFKDGLLFPEAIQHPENQMLKRKVQVDAYLLHLDGRIDARSLPTVDEELKSTLDFVRYGNRIGLSAIVPDIERRVSEIYQNHN